MFYYTYISPLYKHQVFERSCLLTPLEESTPGSILYPDNSSLASYYFSYVCVAWTSENTSGWWDVKAHTSCGNCYSLDYVHLCSHFTKHIPVSTSTKEAQTNLSCYIWAQKQTLLLFCALPPSSHCTVNAWGAACRQARRSHARWCSFLPWRNMACEENLCCNRESSPKQN